MRICSPRVAALALAVGIVLTGAGCSSDEPSGSGTAGSSGSDGSGSSGGGGSGSGGSGSGGADQDTADRDRAVSFAACMRENGVDDFPDPDAAGAFDYGITVSGKVWTTALTACKDLQPPGSFSANRSPEQQAAALRFASCMRENGVRDFPDPVNGDPLVDTTKIPSSERKGGMTIINAAMRECRDAGAGAIVREP